jgi:hypothetical protein
MRRGQGGPRQIGFGNLTATMLVILGASVTGASRLAAQQPASPKDTAVQVAPAAQPSTGQTSPCAAASNQAPRTDSVKSGRRASNAMSNALDMAIMTALRQQFGNVTKVERESEKPVAANPAPGDSTAKPCTPRADSAAGR